MIPWRPLLLDTERLRRKPSRTEIDGEIVPMHFLVLMVAAREHGDVFPLREGWKSYKREYPDWKEQMDGNINSCDRG